MMTNEDMYLKRNEHVDSDCNCNARRYITIQYDQTMWLHENHCPIYGIGMERYAIRNGVGQRKSSKYFSALIDLCRILDLTYVRFSQLYNLLDDWGYMND